MSFGCSHLLLAYTKGGSKAEKNPAGCPERDKVSNDQCAKKGLDMNRIGLIALDNFMALLSFLKLFFFVGSFSVK